MNALGFNGMPIIAVAKGMTVAALTFAVLGTVSALWNNPFFVRMTPTSGFETTALALQAVLVGIYVAIPVRGCAVKLAGAGGVANFLGIACPVCNKILMLIFGANALLTYLEPARPYLAAGGVLVTTLAVLLRWNNFRASSL